VGLLAWQAGFELVFVDKNPDLVEALRRQGRYTVKLFGEGCREIRVTGFRVYHSQERAAIAQEIGNAILVLTAVFDQNLPDVAQTIALGVTGCVLADRQTPLNCLACENMMDSSSTLGRHVRGFLASDAQVWSEKHLGFPDCMISRVVPRPEQDPLVLVTEDYNEWTARAEAFRGPRPPTLTALELVENQTARLERKLFVHNGGHAICGYRGFHRGHRYIHEAVADPVVAEHVLGALDELGAVVQRKWGFSSESLDRYKQDLCRRGAVAEMRDDILRVVRDPIRKLSPRERLVAPALLAVEYGLPCSGIVRGIVAALRYRHPEDPQSQKVGADIKQKGLKGVLEDICHLAPDHPLAEEIDRAWREWRP
jgi:mannitol-1-phosphate 5-dehydrogenase